MNRSLRRRQELVQCLKTDRTDALLILSETNVRYLTGFRGDSSALILLNDRAILVSDGRYTTQIAEECSGLDVHIRSVGTLLNAAIADVLGKLGIRSLAFESAIMTVADFEELKEKLPSLEMTGVKGRVEALRGCQGRGRDRRDSCLDRDGGAGVRDAPRRVAAG